MIVIIGDSWGIGEWSSNSTNPMSLAGPGIAQLLNYNFDVLNLSKGGGTNLLGLHLLEQFLSRFQPSTDEFYWIVTEPIRDIKIENLTNVTSIKTHTMTVLKDSLAKADQLAKQHNIVIKLIGGWCDIDPAWVDNFSNLKVVVSSWGSIVHKNYPGSIFGDMNLQELGTALKTSNSDLVLEWLDIVDRVDAKIATWKTLGWQAHHPDRYAHRMLRDHLYPEFSQYY